MQHAGERNIDRETGGAGHFGSSILPRHGFPMTASSLFGAQRRRLADGNLSLDFAEANAGDAVGKRRGSQGLFVRHGHPLRALAAARVAATTCG